MLGKIGWKATLKTSFCFRSLDARQSGDGEQALAFKPRASARSICRPATAWDQTILYQISILLPSRKGKLDLLYFSFTSSVFSQFSDTFSNQISLALQSCLPLSSAFSNLRQSAAKFWHASPNTCEDHLFYFVTWPVFLWSSLPSKVGKQTNLRFEMLKHNSEADLEFLRPEKLQTASFTPSWISCPGHLSDKKDPRESLSKLYQISFFSWWWGSWIRGTFSEFSAGTAVTPNFAWFFGRLLRKLIQLGRTRM